MSVQDNLRVNGQFVASSFSCSNAQNNLIIGNSATANPAQAQQVSIGFFATANAPSSIAIGQNATTNADDSIAMSTGATVGAGSVQSVSIGQGATVGANCPQSVSLGFSAVVTGSDNGISIGNGASVTGSDFGIAIGSGCEVQAGATNSIAIGEGSISAVANSITIDATGGSLVSDVGSLYVAPLSNYPSNGGAPALPANFPADKNANPWKVLIYLPATGEFAYIQ